MYYTDYLEHYGVKGMKWKSARRKKRTRTGYQDISPHTPSEEAKKEAGARLEKASTLSMKAATKTFSAITKAGTNLLDSFFSSPPDKSHRSPQKVKRRN